MNIAVFGNDSRVAECGAKFGHLHTCFGALDGERTWDVVFDFLDSENTFLQTARKPAKAIFINTANTTLHSVLHSGGSFDVPVFGFAGLPTFLDRGILEVCVSGEGQEQILASVCAELSTAFQIVEDRPGMMTPRVICMIINEAWFALEAKTATREDIDLAMKLGTGYPRGPFEWCDAIGAKHVITLLESMHAEDSDGRYKICGLLRQQIER